MALSKPVYRMLGLYFEQLHSHSMRTKSISSSLVAAFGNLTSQYVSGDKKIDYDNVLAFGIYGLLFGSTLPNIFYRIMLKLFPGLATRGNIVQQLIVERLFYTPLFLAASIYVISRLQIQTTDQASRQLLRHFWPALKTNWLWFTILHYMVLKYGPPLLHIPLFNVVEFIWYIYLSFRLKQKSRK